MPAARRGALGAGLTGLGRLPRRKGAGSVPIDGTGRWVARDCTDEDAREALGLDVAGGARATACMGGRPGVRTENGPQPKFYVVATPAVFAYAYLG